MSYLSQQQIDLLLKRIHPNRVLSRDGMSYVAAHDIKAEMIRVFGFGRWSSEVVEQVCLYETAVETKAKKPAWEVGYRSVVKLTVCAPDGAVLAVYSEGHAGGSTHPMRYEAHGNAITNSESYAFKRAAIMALGDQGGLSLYEKGSEEPFVRWTLVQGGDPGSERAAPNVDDVAPVTADEDTARPEPPPASAMPMPEADSPAPPRIVVDARTGEIRESTRSPEEIRRLALLAQGEADRKEQLRALLMEANRSGHLKAEVADLPGRSGKVALASLIGELMGA